MTSGEVRAALKKAGFAVNDWSDDQLLMLATTARALDAGASIFVSVSMEPMIAALRQNTTIAAPVLLRTREI